MSHASSKIAALTYNDIAGVPEWAARYLGVAVLLHILWGFLGMLWLAYVHTCCVERQLDDLCRVAAQQESLHMKVRSPSSIYMGVYFMLS
jgi:hypothetical protein